MKKDQKRQLIVLFMVVAMFGSSFAFIIMNAFGEEPQQQNSIEFIVDYQLEQWQKDEYISRGFTVMEFHYKEGCCQDFLVYINSIPNVDDLKVSGTSQVITQKILSDTENPYVVVESIYGREERNVSSIMDIFSSLCLVLAMPPSDCAASKIEWDKTNKTSVNWTI